MVRTPLIPLLVLVSIAACGGWSCSGGSTSKKTPTATTATARAGATPAGSATAGAGDIRSVALAQVGEVRKLGIDSMGSFESDLVTFADVTGDGADEALVPLTLGGAQAVVAFIVLQAADTPGGARPILTEYPKETATRGGLAVRVEGGKVVETQPVAGSDDPECCPSQLKVTTYGWNGTALVAESTETIANPDGGVKGTPGSGRPSPSAAQ